MRERVFTSLSLSLSLSSLRGIDADAISLLSHAYEGLGEGGTKTLESNGFLAAKFRELGFGFGFGFGFPSFRVHFNINLPVVEFLSF